MPSLRTLCSLLVVALGVLVAGCRQEEAGRVYGAPIHAVHRLLQDAEIPPLVFGTEAPDFEVDSKEASKIVWIVKKRDKEMLRLVADLAAVSPKTTRIRVSVVGATEGPFGNVAARLAKHPAVAVMYVAAMEERVAATMEDRPFQLTRIYPAIIAARSVAAPSMYQSALRAMEADRKRARDNIAKAYAEE